MKNKVFYLKVIRSHELEPDQAYLVGDFIVAGVRAATWWDNLIDRIREWRTGITKNQNSKIQNSPDTSPDTNTTIGIKITTDHYSDLVGMVRPLEKGRATLSLIPTPKFDQIVSATSQD